jgi:hypothetical protein
MNETRAGFESYLSELVTTCRTNQAIDGLVLMGSGADRSRVDEWSDHDFAVVCATGSEESLRGDLSWLPRRESLAFAAREHHDGFKGVYADGSVVEFAVVDRAQLSTFHANAYEVAYDAVGDLADLMHAVAAKPKPSQHPDAERDFAVFLASLLIGVGRARRGEVLSAWSLVGGQAVDHVLSVLTPLSPADLRADDLDVRRRFELRHPDLHVAAAFGADVETTARALLDFAEANLRPRWPAWPPDRVAVIRNRLGCTPPV